MLKQSINLLICALFSTALFTSCGGGESTSSTSTEETEDAPLKIKPESTKIGGKFGKLYSFEDKEYTIKTESAFSGKYEMTLNITLTRNGEKPSFNLDEVSDDSSKKKYTADIEIEFLDKDGETLFSTDASDISKLLSLEEDDKASITFFTYKTMAEIEEVKYFRLTSILKENSNAGKSSDEEIDEEIDEELEAIGEAANAMGALFGAASEAAKAAEKLSK